jgi:hypothetical protein
MLRIHGKVRAIRFELRAHVMQRGDAFLAEIGGERFAVVALGAGLVFGAGEEGEQA